MNTDNSTTVPAEATAEVVNLPVTPPSTPEPVTIRGVFVKGQLMDADRLKLWGVVSPKGKMAMLGAIAGTVTEIGRGKPTAYDVAAGREDNVWLKGVFVINNLVTGEEAEATTAYLPRHYMDKIDRAFTADTHSLSINCEIGVESTGKAITYAWVVVEFDDSGRNEKLRRELRERSKARKAQNAVFVIPQVPAGMAAQILSGPSPQPALNAPEVLDLTAKSESAA